MTIVVLELQFLRCCMCMDEGTERLALVPILSERLLRRRAADVRAAFGDKRHELNVSTYQMVILLLFNEADRLSYGEIQAATGIPPADLKRSLQSLACVKARARAPPLRPSMPLKVCTRVHWIDNGVISPHKGREMGRSCLVMQPRTRRP